MSEDKTEIPTHIAERALHLVDPASEEGKQLAARLREFGVTSETLT